MGTRIYADDPNTATLEAVKERYAEAWDARESVTLRRIAAVMPPVVRYLDRTNYIVALERPPQRINIQYFPGNKRMAAEATPETGLRTFTISLPWQVYIARFNHYQGSMRPSQLHPTIRPRPLHPDDDMLWRMPLPNILDYGAVCDSTHLPEIHDMDIVSATMAYVTNFLVSGFNTNAGSTPNVTDEFTGMSAWGTILQRLEDTDPMELCKMIDQGKFAEEGRLLSKAQKPATAVNKRGKLQP